MPVPPAAANFPHPGLGPVRHLDGLDCRVDPGERNTDPLERKQSDFISNLEREIAPALALIPDLVVCGGGWW